MLSNVSRNGKLMKNDSMSLNASAPNGLGVLKKLREIIGGNMLEFYRWVRRYDAV